jgi:hypothetical protein
MKHLLLLSVLLLLFSVATAKKKFCSVVCDEKDCNGNLKENCDQECMHNW